MSKSLTFKPIAENHEIVSDSVSKLAESWKGLVPVNELLCAEIDPQYAGSKEFCEHYEVDPHDGANCIIIEVTKGSDKNFACCLVPVGYRADLNGIVRKHFNAKRISFAPLEQVIQETGMEYGSITPFGLPSLWPILVDSKIMEKEKIIVGGGKKISKLLLPTKVFQELPSVEIIEGLSNPVTI